MHLAVKRRPTDQKSIGTFIDLKAFVPAHLKELADLQTAIPRLAKDDDSVRLIEQAVQTIPTSHDLYLGDARDV